MTRAQQAWCEHGGRTGLPRTGGPAMGESPWGLCVLGPWDALGSHCQAWLTGGLTVRCGLGRASEADSSGERGPLPPLGRGLTLSGCGGQRSGDGLGTVLGPQSWWTLLRSWAWNGRGGQLRPPGLPDPRASPLRSKSTLGAREGPGKPSLWEWASLVELSPRGHLSMVTGGPQDSCPVWSQLGWPVQSVV